jgi:hypothetical protein
MFTESIKRELKNFYSNMWVQVMLLSFVFIAIFGSVILYLQWHDMISTANFNFYSEAVPAVGIFVITMAVIFWKDHKERRSTK